MPVEWPLWVKCDKHDCERVCRTNSDWYRWWLVRPRRMSNLRRKTIVRCPEHVTLKALIWAGVEGAQSKRARWWLDEVKNHLDDDPQPGPLVNIVFPTREEYEIMRNVNLKWLNR